MTRPHRRLLDLLRWRRKPLAETLAFTVNVSFKPRVRITSDGWVRHCGGPFPFNKWLIVETLHANGTRIIGSAAEHAGNWPEAWWLGERHCWKWAIVGYRIIGVVRI